MAIKAALLVEIWPTKTIVLYGQSSSQYQLDLNALLQLFLDEPITLFRALYNMFASTGYTCSHHQIWTTDWWWIAVFPSEIHSLLIYNKWCDLYLEFDICWIYLQQYCSNIHISVCDMSISRLQMNFFFPSCVVKEIFLMFHTCL